MLGSRKAAWPFLAALMVVTVGNGAAASSPPSTPPHTACPGIAPGFSCLMRQRIAAVEKYLAGAPGSMGLVLDDRATGAIWRSANAAVEYPAASTMKLAMITDMLLRDQPGAAGHIHLTGTDRKEMYQALYTSNDIDANDLWDKYENGSFLRRIQAFGMSRAEFTGSPPNWGFMYCTAEDLDDLINYVLTKPPASIRDYLVYRLRHVSPIDQQWGVWGAGPENKPGNKDGWEHTPADGSYWWITNSVGFAVPGPEYTLAMMYNLYGYGGNGDAGFYYGVNELTQIASILFQGHHAATPHPAPSAVP
jgi:hypothetical protein